MTTQHFFSALGLFISALSFAQEKDIDTVFIFDHHLRTSDKFQKIQTLKEEDLLRNTANLSEVLRFQSPIYIKENGRGAVSSPSFRGTTAQQTAFVWNGININSAFLGQADINNLNLLGFDEVQIKSGGGSVVYGSGAIGGTVHLNNELAFDRGFGSTVFLEGGSFGTYNALAKAAYSDERLAVKFSGNFVTSENDYEVPEKHYLNRNGQYKNQTFNLGAAYRVAPGNTLYWQTQLFSGLQHYPIFSEFTTPTHYRSDTFRSLIDWRYRSAKVQNSVKLAFLQDEFSYFDRPDRPKSSGGLSKTYLVKNDLNYLLHERLGLNMIAEYQLNQAEGYQSGLQNPQRNAGSLAMLARWKANKGLDFEAGVKKDFVQNIAAPFLFSLSGKVQVRSWYDVTLNVSKNFRYPSFNDLYWQPGGNLDLKPELSYQAELRQTIKHKNFSISATPFYLDISDMIRWLPNSKGIWTAMNTNKVVSYGLESQLTFSKKKGAHKTHVSAGYTFTDSRNSETDLRLSYVPQHRIFGTASYAYRFLEFYAQGNYNSLSFTTEDEASKYALSAHFVANAGVSVELAKHLCVGFKVHNLFDEVYATAAAYPMPKRHYSLNLLINL